ncbi:M28 family metallopeptidase [Steroidobacter flavus]|uniref:M28 family metallopeptidase n=1 Tax=Steroidobacter flavus TaxID=1842136 RepID=A0ABV8SNK3_9GAMM
MHTRYLLRAALSGALALVTASALAAPSSVIDPEKITGHVRVLASDEFEGRAPASAGEKKTVDYLIAQLKASGLQPGGDPQESGRAWTQDVPLLRSEIKGPMSISVRTDSETLEWKQSEQIVIRAAQTGTNEVAINAAPIVFAGYGVTAPERKWDDFKGIDLKGKVVLMLVNDPDFETGQGDFGGKAMTYYGRWTYKFEEAARRGAAGVLVIHEEAPAAYPWATPANSDAAPMFDILRRNPLEQHTPMEGWIHRDAAVDLFKRAGLDFAELKAQAQTREFRPVTLQGVNFSTKFAVDTQRVISKNVVAIAPGKKHPSEYVVYSAHWDHVGVGRPDAKGDAIYNGAVDNAAGVAQVIEIARTFAAHEKTDRSVVFLFVTAEEKNLLGTEYYATNPLYPLATTVADLNTDAPRPTGPSKDFTTAGEGGVTLQDYVIAVAKEFDRYFTPDPLPAAGRFFRSDHFALAKRGVPAISFKSGTDLVDGGRALGEAFDKAYTSSRYHQPSDEFTADWRSDGIAADASLLYEVGRRLANSREWPTWKAGSEFKQIRDTTESQRR